MDVTTQNSGCFRLPNYWVIVVIVAMSWWLARCAGDIDQSRALVVQESELSADGSYDESAQVKFNLAVPAKHKLPTQLVSSDSVSQQIEQLRQAIEGRENSMRMMINQQAALMKELQVVAGGCSLDQLKLDVIKVVPVAVKQEDRLFGKGLYSSNIEMYQVDVPDQLTISWADDMIITTEPSAFFQGGYSTTEFADKSLADIDYMTVTRTGFDTFNNREVKTQPDGFFGRKKLKFNRYGYHEMSRYTLKEIQLQVTSGDQTRTVYSRVDLNQGFYWPVARYAAYNIQFEPDFLALYNRQDSACAR